MAYLAEPGGRVESQAVSEEEAAGVLSERDRAILKAVCDTVVPAIERDRDPDGLLGAQRPATSGVDEGAAQLIAEIPDPTIRGGPRSQLLDALGAAGLPAAPRSSRASRSCATSRSPSPRPRPASPRWSGMTLFLALRRARPGDRPEPELEDLRLPGPDLGRRREVPKPLEIHEPEGDEETLEADVCIVGSGSGGGVIAGDAREARARRSSCSRRPATSTSPTSPSSSSRPTRRCSGAAGPTPTADGNVSLSGRARRSAAARRSTGPTACAPGPGSASSGRASTASRASTAPTTTATSTRCSSGSARTTSCSDLNGPQQRMKEGAEALGWSFETIIRNADPDKYSPEIAGYLGFGDQSGAQADRRPHLARRRRRSTAPSFLAHCRAQRVLTEGGRAAGVEAVWRPPEGSASGRGHRARAARRGRLRLARVAGAAAALGHRRPGGRATTCACIRASVIVGLYGDDQQAWWGAPQAGLCDEFADTGDGYGFLIETAQYAPGLIGSATPWISAPRPQGAHAASSATAAPSSASPATAATARSTVDAERRGGARLLGHRRARPATTCAAGSRSRSASTRRRARTRSTPLADRRPDLAPRRRPRGLHRPRSSGSRSRAGGHKLFSAHQMGTCRMGTDPQTSVAGPLGRAARHQGRLDRRRQRVPDLVGDQPDGLDHGARAPHRGGDRRARRRSAEARSQRQGRQEVDRWQPRHRQPPQAGHPTEPIVRDRLFIGGEWVEPAGLGARSR